MPKIENCFYKTLGVPKDANRDEVRKAYFAIAKKWHPDKVDGNDEAVKYFTHVTQAYETLYDDHKRAIYDDDTIPDSEYFSVAVGPLKVNVLVLFIVCTGASAAYFLNRKFGFIGSGGSKEGACPVDHGQRQEMARMAAASQK